MQGSRGRGFNEALSALSKKVKESTIVIPLLNGADIHERIRNVLSKGIVLPACAYVGTHIEETGIVTQKGSPCTILCGKDPAFMSEIVAIAEKKGSRCRPGLWKILLARPATFPLRQRPHTSGI